MILHNVCSDEPQFIQMILHNVCSDEPQLQYFCFQCHQICVKPKAGRHKLTIGRILFDCIKLANRRSRSD